jgi:hypothetical protein
MTTRLLFASNDRLINRAKLVTPNIITNFSLQTMTEPSTSGFSPRLAQVALYALSQAYYFCWLSPLFSKLDSYHHFWGPSNVTAATEGLDVTECTETEKYSMGWNSVPLGVSTVQLSFLAFRARNNEDKLRRLCVFVNYCLFLQLAGYIFSSNKDFNGVAFQENSVRVGMVTSMLLLALGGHNLRSGPLAPATHALWRLKGPADQALLAYLLVMNFFIGSGMFLGQDKLLADPSLKTALSTHLFSWTLVVMIQVMLWCVYTAAFEGYKTKRLFCALFGILAFSVQVYSMLPVSVNHLTDPSMANRAIGGRVALMAFSAYGFAAPRSKHEARSELPPREESTKND